MNEEMNKWRLQIEKQVGQASYRQVCSITNNL